MNDCKKQEWRQPTQAHFLGGKVESFSSGVILKLLIQISGIPSCQGVLFRILLTCVSVLLIVTPGPTHHIPGALSPTEPMAHGYGNWGTEQVGHFYNLTESIADSGRCRAVYCQAMIHSSVKKNPLFYSVLSQPGQWQGVFCCCHSRSWLLVWALAPSLRRQRGGSRALIPAGTRVLGWPICRIILLRVIWAKSWAWDLLHGYVPSPRQPEQAWWQFRGRKLKCFGELWHREWHLRQRARQVKDLVGYILQTRSCSQKTRTCQRNEQIQPGLWFGLIASKLIFKFFSRSSQLGLHESWGLILIWCKLEWIHLIQGSLASLHQIVVIFKGRSFKTM